MKTLLIILLLSFSLTAQAGAKEDAKAIRNLAAELFMEQATSGDFDWKDVSCEHLMQDAIEVATKAYYKKMNKQIRERNKPKEIQL